VTGEGLTDVEYYDLCAKASAYPDHRALTGTGDNKVSDMVRSVPLLCDTHGRKLGSYYYGVTEKGVAMELYKSQRREWARRRRLAREAGVEPNDSDARSLQVLADERLPVTEYPQSPARMTPATTGLYEAVVNGTVTHSGDKRLARHVSNAVLKVDTRGSRLVKETKHSKRHIDLAVAAVMAHSRAVELARRPKPSIYVG
jgi:hypothetical protein